VAVIYAYRFGWPACYGVYTLKASWETLQTPPPHRHPYVFESVQVMACPPRSGFGWCRE